MDINILSLISYLKFDLNLLIWFKFYNNSLSFPSLIRVWLDVSFDDSNVTESDSK